MSDSVDCSEFHSLGNITDICAFVRNTSSCDIDEGFINYVQFIYCDLSALPVAAACIFLIIWWLFLFCGLAVTADDFFCPSLAVISRNLHLSHNVAGVTFLAFGNGAPDIFSAIAAIGNAKAGDAGLAIGALFGAGVFVTAVVAGSISIIHPFECMQRPFLRDVTFYLVAVFWAWYVMWDKKIVQLEAIGFILLYIFYVFVVVMGRYINQRLKKTRTAMKNVLEVSVEDSNEHAINAHPINVEIETAALLQQYGPPNQSIVYNILSDINPINTEEWSSMKIYAKFYEIFKSPLVILLKLTVPIVSVQNDEEPDGVRNWNRGLNSLHLLLSPVFSVIVTKVGFITVTPGLQIWMLVLPVSTVFSVIVFLTSKTDRRPPYHTFFAYLGFLVAVVWIYSIANEIVNILQALGVVFHMSDAILGLTLLAWGNSIGDFIADTTMARQGYPRMGISACFGGPLFNLLLGLGIPFTIACIKHGGTFELQVRTEEMVLAGGLGASLVASLIIVTASGFKMSRPYGVFLLCLYVAFLLVAILTEVGVIQNNYIKT